MLLKSPWKTGKDNALPGICFALAAMLIFGRACAAEETNTSSAVLSSAARDYLNQVLSGGPTHTHPALAHSNEVTTNDNEDAKLLSVDALDNEHKLGVGDKVSFRIEEDKVLNDKNDSIPLFVTDSGELEIPYLGRIPAVGKTCLQLAGELKTLLESKYYYHANVLLGVDILNKTRGRVYLAGKVKVPGYLEIPSDEVFTVSKAIMRAGGFSEFADKRHVKVTCKRANTGPDGDTMTIDVAEVLEKGLAGKDLQLGPDDRVFVPSKLINF